MGLDTGMGLLTAPFTKIAANGQGDLQRALARTTCYSEIQLVKDVDANGNDMGIINIFAKYKPFPYNGIWANDSAGKAARLAANQSTNYALTIPTFTGWNALITGTPNYATKWTYNKPAGTSLQPLRALDFDGYLTDCREWSLDGSTDTILNAPFGFSMSVPGKEIGLADVINVDIIKGNPVTNDYLLYLDAFHTNTLPLNQYYFGVLAVVPGSTADSRIYVSDQRWSTDPSADALHFDIPVASLTSGTTYTLVPIMCSTKRASLSFVGSIPENGQVVTLSGYNFPGYKVTANSPNLNVSAYFKSQTSTTTTFEVKIRNRTGAAIDLTDIFMFAEPAYTVDWDATTDQYIAEQTDWTSTSKTDAQFKANIVYNNKVVAHYVDIYSVLAARGGTNPTRIGSGSQYDVTLSVTLNAVADGNGHPYNNESNLIGWFRFNRSGTPTKYRF